MRHIYGAVQRSQWRITIKDRSPDGAKRNPGSTLPIDRALPDYASLHPGYNPTTPLAQAPVAAISGAESTPSRE